MEKNIALYIHIPFCIKKCSYCDFVSYPKKENVFSEYVECLCKEIELTAIDSNYSVSSIFIGGGTPSILDEGMIGKVLDKVRRKFKVNDTCEITIESNPGTLSENKLRSYKSIGINRLSIGAQAMQDKLLKVLGRIHDKNEIVKSFIMARNAGFININLDLMFGIPGQTMNDWKETLEEIISIGPEHISCYSLKIEKHTLFDKIYSADCKAGTEWPALPSEDEEREMYHYAISYLKKNGCQHYEISNFCKPGCECRQNMQYWKCGEYIGFGAGAHSYYRNYRFKNVNSVEKYIEYINKSKNHKTQKKKIDLDESISEAAILGLRLIDGIDLTEFRKKYSKDFSEIFKKQINEMINKGLLCGTKRNICLTEKGIDFANYVMSEFMF